MEGAEVAALARQHKKLTWQRIGIVAGLTLIAAAAFVISNFVGAIDISPSEVIKGIVNPAGLEDQTRTVLWQLRLPMAVMAVLIGMALSLAGAEMQTILNNPLAEPFTLGISAAAAFGGASSIVLKWQLIAQPQFNLALVAWLAAAVATAIIVIAAVIRGAKAETMVLLGIGLVFFFQAMLALIQYQSSAEALQQIVFWSMGSLTRANWAANGVLAAVLIIALPILWALGWRLTALRLGDARATAMGDLDRVQRQREFFAALVKKVSSAGTLANPFRLLPTITTVTGSFTVGEKDHVWNLARVALAMRSGVTTETVPVGGFGNYDVGSVVLWDEEGSQQLFNSLK